MGAPVFDTDCCFYLLGVFSYSFELSFGAFHDALADLHSLSILQLLNLSDDLFILATQQLYLLQLVFLD